MNNVDVPSQPYPREIMAWSDTYVFGPVFSAEKFDGRSAKVWVRGHFLCFSFVKSVVPIPEMSAIIDDFNSSRTCFAQFSLRENDYVLDNRKIGGNAQTIVRNRWVHHTSFLWDFNAQRMQYLKVCQTGY
jgi:hypothetical protein